MKVPVIPSSVRYFVSISSLEYTRTHGQTRGSAPTEEKKMWIGDFCQDFFLTFIFQYIAFKTRNPQYLALSGKGNFEIAIDTAKKEGLEYLIGVIESAAYSYNHEHVDMLWEIVRNTPKDIAFTQREYIVQLIDEFQFLNAKFYRDKALNILQQDMAAGYLSTAESKIAPLLISGS
ncbi:MAG: hypothetical protein ACM3SY_04835 [Candidatus Omnitrophota bacterium]